MDRQTTDDITHVVQQLRAALEPGLPYGASLIPLDILIAVESAHPDGPPLTARQLIYTRHVVSLGVRFYENYVATSVPDTEIT